MTHEQTAHIMALPTGWSIRPSQIYSGAFCIEGPGSSTLINTADNLHPLFAAISAPQQAEEILQSLGWTCIGGVWTEDRAATATLASKGTK